MSLAYDFSFYLLITSTIMILSLLFFIIKMNDKVQIHYAFLSLVSFLFIWCVGHVFEVITTIVYGQTIMFFVYLYYFGLCFTPVAILFTGIIFVKNRINFSLKYYLLFILPIIDYMILITNSIHKGYFIKYSIFTEENVLGNLINIHFAITYIYILIGFFFLIRFSIKNSGFFSKQSIFIQIGLMIPLALNVLISFNIIYLPVYATPIAFSFSSFFWAFAILKFDFLNIVPIALQKIVDLISDSYIIIGKDYVIVDYNKPFVDNFKTIFKIKRKDNLLKLLNKQNSLGISPDKLIEFNNKAIISRDTERIEISFTDNGELKYYLTEITPIYFNDDYSSSIILLKNITQSKLDLETIKKNQNIIMEQERLASLGQLIGGISHNLRTSIMSLSGGIQGLKDLTNEYETSIGDPRITDEDHKSIAAEMHVWLEKMMPYCTYMSDIIKTVKGQVVQFNTTSMSSFTVDELIKRVKLLMKHELSTYFCVLNIIYDFDARVEIKGDVNSLVQIFDNLIINSIQSYEGKSGTIDIKIIKEDSKILFAITDYGKGISDTIKNKLFKQMVTTKGSGGTGLGLYVSYSTIKGHFSGDMWFESKCGVKTTFYISIPYLNSFSNLEAVL